MNGQDDFAFVIDEDNSNGYFTSDRPGGAGGDDIYAFTMHYPLEQRFLCTGTVTDDNALPVPDVELVLLNADGVVVESTGAMPMAVIHSRWRRTRNTRCGPAWQGVMTHRPPQHGAHRAGADVARDVRGA